MFDPKYQPWTGGGEHFSFLNQPQAAKKNYLMFCKSLAPLLDKEYLQRLWDLESGFGELMQIKMRQMWREKLGLERFDADVFNELMALMVETSVDYTLFFRELSNIPDDVYALTSSFYKDACGDRELMQRWEKWLVRWRTLVNADDKKIKEKTAAKMKKVNPKYTLRQWLLVPAYKGAENGDFNPIYELQEVMCNPYDEQLASIQKKYYKKMPTEFFDVAGISHLSCSS